MASIIFTDGILIRPSAKKKVAPRKFLVMNSRRWTHVASHAIRLFHWTSTSQVPWFSHSEEHIRGLKQPCVLGVVCIMEWQWGVQWRTKELLLENITWTTPSSRWSQPAGEIMHTWVWWYKHFVHLKFRCKRHNTRLAQDIISDGPISLPLMSRELVRDEWLVMTKLIYDGWRSVTSMGHIWRTAYGTLSEGMLTPLTSGIATHHRWVGDSSIMGSIMQPGTACQWCRLLVKKIQNIVCSIARCSCIHLTNSHMKDERNTPQNRFLSKFSCHVKWKYIIIQVPF